MQSNLKKAIFMVCACLWKVTRKSHFKLMGSLPPLLSVSQRGVGESYSPEAVCQEDEADVQALPGV